MIVLVCGDLTQEPGHLKPFGEGRPSQLVEEIDYYPLAKDFFENYVIPLKPVKIKGAAKMSSAFWKWRDDYFLSVEDTDDQQINVETRKKENRDEEVKTMKFKEFVKIYNHSEYYMVDSVPKFLSNDVLVPCPLQCKSLMNSNLVETVMWYSSGGTKSVVHVDNVDNINCLYRGDKSFVFVDPSKYRNKVDLDRLDGSYSSMDVDSVDYVKFPGMAEVEYYHVHITAGDCLYIPYDWIHQVRSYDSNIAVNVWWKHGVVTEGFDYTSCNNPCNTELTLDKVNFIGLEDFILAFDEIKQMLLPIFETKDNVDIKQFQRYILGDHSDVLLLDAVVMSTINKIFNILDSNSDNRFTKEEIDVTSDQILADIRKLFASLENRFESMRDEDKALDEVLPPKSDDDLHDHDLHVEL
ncbi:hypothetical protein ACF0H5_003694 [Mactra antiquata]